MIAHMKSLASRNKAFKSFIGLTGLPMSNAALLDQGTATAEAMAMCNNIARGKKKTFLIASNYHPQMIDICKTRAAGFDLMVVKADLKDFDYSSEDKCGVLIQYPGTEGEISDYTDFIRNAHANGVKVMMATDLLALTMLKPPRELGVAMVLGPAQRFGVPMGYGGPRAAFLATSQGYKKNGQCRLERSILQSLLANMAAMYGVSYHGPEGLKTIAERVHGLAGAFVSRLKKLGTVTVKDGPFFDTMKVKCADAKAVLDAALQNEINLQVVDSNTITVSFDETITLDDVDKLLKVFSGSEYKVRQDSVRLGNIGVIRAGTVISKTWEDGQALKDIQVHLRNLWEQKEAIERHKKSLKKCQTNKSEGSDNEPGISQKEFLIQDEICKYRLQSIKLEEDMALRERDRYELKKGRHTCMHGLQKHSRNVLKADHLPKIDCISNPSKWNENLRSCTARPYHKYDSRHCGCGMIAKEIEEEEDGDTTEEGSELDSEEITTFKKQNKLLEKEGDEDVEENERLMSIEIQCVEDVNKTLKKNVV
eukprot:Gb_02235 [translate_table: standard]